MRPLLVDQFNRPVLRAFIPSRQSINSLLSHAGDNLGARSANDRPVTNTLAPGKRIGREHVTRVVTLFLDIDSVRQHPEKSKANAIDLARGLVREQLKEGWGMPNVIDSGNGAGLFYGVDLANTNDSVDLIKRTLLGLAKRFNTDGAHVDRSVYDPPRIAKLPGSYAGKEVETPDRPGRRAHTLHTPTNRVTLTPEMLEVVAVAKSEPVRPVRTLRSGPLIDVEAVLMGAGVRITRIKRTPENDGNLYEFTPCVWDPTHTNRASFVIRYDNGALYAKCHHDGCGGLGWRDFREAIGR